MAVRPFVVGVSGASGAVLARRCVEMLLARELPVALTVTDVAAGIWQDELGTSLSQDLAVWGARVRYYPAEHMPAPIASGSYRTRGMIVVPCSMATVAAIAHGTSTSLLTRAADVCLKEGRRLVLVPRETPLSAIHLENLLRLARLGVRIVPPVPAFYNHPTSLDEVVDFVVGRALEALGVPDGLPASYRYVQEEP
ncbi:MAG: UbiX family flavin prenyltransferase [Bacteroidetes bacterium]|nr:UbiX family flavin prenyltransferase [Bacteroidota bacterium]MCL5025869.1 UbiX family flavin prenyltransferase [Chloroflexota bacterium]